MKEKLDQITKKIQLVAELLERAKLENTDLKGSNDSLRKELAKARKDLEVIGLSRMDQTDKVKTKLSSVLKKLEELEQYTN